MVITVTKEEQKAIKSLERLAKKWPGSIDLFSWSGSLCVLKDQHLIIGISGIPNDGGDPSDDEVKQSGYTIEYD